MREILFRGISIESKKFIYGDLIQDLENNRFAIIEQSQRFSGFSEYEVFPKSIGQLTVLLDKNNGKIFWGDIVVKIGVDYNNIGDNPDYANLPEVELNRDIVDLSVHWFWLKNESFGYEGEDLQDPKDYEVIGNIHENPELLNQKS